MNTIRKIYPRKRRYHGSLSLSGLYFSAVSMLGQLIWEMEKRPSRVALLALTDEQLKHVALSRADACREMKRRFRV
ncbi:hypothetical protein [Rhizobium mesoamericanum]|uniref:DUF1127 domain-containing protein n=1 Tax=Rhizobium mesoamericanum STM3625 TaxID=1211777 RepID=K0PZF4_9HYPH|nr:hypothetical protein [Rhizobium mesoamericanum]CCM77180.1 exported hypothetical protein [Rhizobium mesoamericanum STM3625]